MKHFIAKLLILIVLAGVITVGEWWRIESRIEQLGPVGGSVDLMAKAVSVLREVPDPKVIFAGDSKAERHFVPHVFLEAGVPAVNLGYFSMDLWALVNTFERLGLHLRSGVFAISVGAYQINDGNNEPGRLSPDMFFNMTPWERVRMFRSGYFAAARGALKYASTFERFDELVAEATAIAPADPYIGFVGVGERDYSCVRFRHNSRVSPASIYRNIQLNGARWRLFQEAIRKLSTWPGKYIFYTGPESEKSKNCRSGTYAEDMDLEFSRRMSDLTAQLNNVRYIDLSEREGMGLTERDYYDPSHLNTEGAKKFTRWWLGYLRELRWL